MTKEVLTELHGMEIGLDDDRALVVRSGVVRSHDGSPVSFPDSVTVGDETGAGSFGLYSAGGAVRDGNISVANGSTSAVDQGDISYTAGTHIFKGYGGEYIAELVSMPDGVNYWRIQPSITSGAISLSAQGSDTNISVAIAAKGTGSVWVGNGWASIARFDDDNTSTNCTNYFKFQSTVLGTDLILGCDSTLGWPDVGMVLRANGASTIKVERLRTPSIISHTGKTVQVVTAGFSYTPSSTAVSHVLFNPAGVLATGTITMPASPIDGHYICFSTTQTITALTVNANSGQTISGAPTTMTASTPFAFIYDSNLAKWMRA